MDITVIMNGLKPDLSTEVIKADPPDDGGPEERGKATPNDHPDGAGIFKLALLNALQDMREDVRKNRQQHQRCLNYIVPASSRIS